MSKEKKKFTASKRLVKVEPIVVVEEKPVPEVTPPPPLPLPSYRAVWQEYRLVAQKEELDKISEFCNLIDFHWVGYKKNTDRGKIWGYFTEKRTSGTYPLIFLTRYSSSYSSSKCFVFSGKIGGEVKIVEHDLNVIRNEAQGKTANYKTMEVDKLIRLIAGWADFRSEIGMFLTYRKLANG